jgi:hypothetical protein
VTAVFSAFFAISLSASLESGFLLKVGKSVLKKGSWLPPLLPLWLPLL